MSRRTSPVTPERANVLGAHAAEAETELKEALRILEKLGTDKLAPVREAIRDARERLAIIRLECYWEPNPDYTPNMGCNVCDGWNCTKANPHGG